jgi:DNA-binding transcriptional MerR regulator
VSDDRAEAIPGSGIPNKLYFRIGEVAKLVAVEPHVLRYWESEFRMRPHRSASGQRLYRKKDIARFLKIKKLLHAEGFTISGARKALSGSSRAPAGNTADAANLREAVKRLEALRGSIAALKRDLDLG